MGSSPTKKAKVRARIALDEQRKRLRQAASIMSAVKEREVAFARRLTVATRYTDSPWDELRRMAKDMGLEHLLPTTTGGGRRES